MFDYIKKWFHGKGVKPTDAGRSVPTSGEPDSYIDIYTESTGKIHRRRKFDRSGKVYLDLDRGYQNTTEKEDHAHDWVDGKRRKKRSLTKKEKIEFLKMKKKRKVRHYDK